ncbi:NERD domain-containing protein [Pimelobacter simplex]|nr:NERD domain-containing protein [Pimelobacter simplex]
MAEREAQGTFKHVLSRLVGARTEERAWRFGADGEEAVAAQLLALGPAWRVLHAVRVGERGSDIDHVVVGPPGVFTVNAKHHPNASIWVGGDTFMVNGQRVPYIRNSRHEARRAARLLTEHAGFPVTAAGVIAVMGAHKGFKIRAQPEDGAVVVVTRRRIAHHLLSQPHRLSPREVDAVYDIARRSTTWRS